MKQQNLANELVVLLHACAILPDQMRAIQVPDVQVILDQVIQPGDEELYCSGGNELQYLLILQSRILDLTKDGAGLPLHGALCSLLNQHYLNEVSEREYGWLRQDLLGVQALALAQGVVHACGYFGPLQFVDSQAGKEDAGQRAKEVLSSASHVWALYLRCKAAAADIQAGIGQNAIPISNPSLLAQLVEQLDSVRSMREQSPVAPAEVISELASMCIQATSPAGNTKALNRAKPFEGSTEEIEQAISQWMASIRVSFGKDRCAYNFAVADALLASGCLPNAATVLRIGRWGQTASVAEDFQLWVSSLAKRVSEQEAALPAPIRSKANALLTSIVELVQGSMQESFADPAWQALSESRLRLSESLLGARQKLRGSEESLVGVQTDLEATQGKLAQASDQLAQSQAKLDQSTQENARLSRAVSDLALQNSATEKELTKAKHETEMAHAQARRDVLEQERSLLAAHQKTMADREAASENSLRHTQLQLDAARQEAQAANKQTIKAGQDLVAVQEATSVLRLSLQEHQQKHEPLIKDLAMLVRRLAGEIPEKDKQIREGALDFLERNKLTGDVLR